MAGETHNLGSDRPPRQSSPTSRSNTMISGPASWSRNEHSPSPLAPGVPNSRRQLPDDSFNNKPKQFCKEVFSFAVYCARRESWKEILFPTAATWPLLRHQVTNVCAVIEKIVASQPVWIFTPALTLAVLDSIVPIRYAGQPPRTEPRMNLTQASHSHSSSFLTSHLHA